MDENSPESPEPSEQQCPACGQAVSMDPLSEGPLQCDQCGEQFSVAQEPDAGASEILEDEDKQAEEDLRQKHESELSEMRIRQISGLRRNAIRTRSWLIVGAIACVVGAAQLVFLAIRGYRHGLRTGPVGDVLFAIAALMIGSYFVRRAREFIREIEKSRLEEPISPPDFSTLNDGSQRWKALDELSRKLP
jgi:ribosomal protein L37AE/L43A